MVQQCLWLCRAFTQERHEYPSFTVEDELPAREAALLALDAAQQARANNDSELVRCSWGGA